jgi:putative phosphoserine phosphatase / 1-acylglycerol-3-phosphate O-acyltransferase
METTFSKDSKTDKNHIAFFDLDRTIIKTVSGKALARSAFRRGLMTSSDIVYAIYLSIVHKLKLKEPLKVIHDMVSWVEGIPEKTMTDLCSEVFHETLLPSVHPEARSEIKSHKEKNARVVILSSALSPVCLEMAKSLGIDDIICSDLEVKNGYLTGKSIGPLCFGKEKTIRLLEYCEKNNAMASDAWYYADSISDLPALIVVGSPVCVNPDRKLKKEALKRGWKILQWQ